MKKEPTPKLKRRPSTGFAGPPRPDKLDENRDKPDENRVCAGKNRLTQVARAGSRKLFDAGRRESFLEWFAATCNVKLSAEKAGVCYQTVFKHRMKDEAFAEAWDRALQQGYAYLEARLLQEAVSPPTVIASDAKQSSAGSPRRSAPRDDEIEAAFDPELAILLLREHARRLPGSGDKRKNRRTSARMATNEEVRDALVKRLKAFGMRQRSSVVASEAKQSRGTDRIAASSSALRNDKEQ